MTQIEPDASTTLILGRGVNSLTLAECASGIDDSTAFVPPNADGQTVIYELRQIDSISRLREALNISAGASFAGLSGTGSAKSSFFHSVEFSSYAFYLYIRVKVTNGRTVLKDYKLKDEAREYLQQNGALKFFQMFGDEFVAATTSGGELIAIIQINTSTKEEKIATSAAAEASFGVYSAKADFSRAIDSFNMNSATRVYILRRGGSGELPEVSQIKEVALSFPEAVSLKTGHPVLLQVTTLDYFLAGNRPKDLTLVNLDSNRQVFEQMAAARELAVVRRADCRFAADNPFFFQNPDVAGFIRAGDDCKILIDRIDNAVRDCLRSDGLICNAPDLTLPTTIPVWDIPLQPGLSVMVHLEGYGDLSGVADKYVGTKGESRRIEGIAISLSPALPGLYVEYFVHGQEYGDTPWARDGAFVGTRGQSLRVEGFAIRLIGPLAPYYDVVYEGHFEGLGDMSKQNGEFCGTRGENRRCEGIRVSVSRRK